MANREPNYGRMKGPGDFDPPEDDLKAESIAELAAQYASDDTKRREAEEWIAGGFDSEFYTDLTLALYDLHTTDPANLLGTQTLTNLYRLAKVVAGKMDAELERMAADDLDREDRNHD